MLFAEARPPGAADDVAVEPLLALGAVGVLDLLAPAADEAGGVRARPAGRDLLARLVNSIASARSSAAFSASTMSAEGPFRGAALAGLGDRLDHGLVQAARGGRRTPSGAPPSTPASRRAASSPPCRAERRGDLAGDLEPRLARRPSHFSGSSSRAGSISTARAALVATSSSTTTRSLVNGIGRKAVSCAAMTMRRPSKLLMVSSWAR